MSRMICIALALAIGCKQKPAEEMGASPGKSAAMGTSGDMGSAMGTRMHDAAIDAAPVRTAADITERYDECLRFANEAHDELHTCYVDAARIPKLPDDVVEIRREPKLVLVSGNTIVSIVLVNGKHAQTKKPLGFLLANVIAMDSYGRFVSDEAFFDMARTGAQGLPMKITLVAKNDELEMGNLVATSKLAEATKTPLERAWAAGEFVAVIERDADRRVLVIHRFADGKAAQTWRFPSS